MGKLRLSASDKVEFDDAAAPVGSHMLGPNDQVALEQQVVGPPGMTQVPAGTFDREDRAKDRGAVDAFGRSLLQGGSFGFWDELAAGVKSLAESKDIRSLGTNYHKNVGDERALLHAAEEHHPVASTLGQVAGGVATSFVPGVGMARLGTGFAANAARGAGAGILSGAGNSEADTLGGVVSDAAKSGLAGAAVGGVVGTLAEKAVGGAQGRVDKRLVQDITGGRATSAGKKIYQNEGLVVQTAKKFNLNPEAAAPGELFASADAARQEIGQKLGAAYQAIGDDTLGARTADAVKAIKGVRAEYGAPSEAPLRRQIDTYLGDVADRWGGKRVSLAELNGEIGNLEKVGFAGADLSPVAAKQLKRDLASALEDVLQSRLEEVKDLGSKIAKSPLAARDGFAGVTKAAEAAQAIPELNKDYRGLKYIVNAAKDRANLPPNNQAAGGLRNTMEKAVDAGLAFSHPLGFAAKKAVEYAAPVAARTADNALASLYAAAQTGQVSAQLIQQAIQAGVPRGLIDRLSASVAGPSGQ